MKQFPTDNLYKFIALSGLSISLLSFWFIGKERAATIIAVSKIEAQQEILGDKIVRILEVDDIQTSEEIQNINDQKDKLFMEVESAKIKFKLLKEATYFYFLTGILGLFWMLLGFYLWYVRVQVFEDQILKNRASTKN